MLQIIYVRHRHRHTAPVTIAMREFGAWEVVHAAPSHDANALMMRVAEWTAAASPSVRATFKGFVAARRA